MLDDKEYIKKVVKDTRKSLDKSIEVIEKVKKNINSNNEGKKMRNIILAYEIINSLVDVLNSADRVIKEYEKQANGQAKQKRTV